MDFKKQYEIYKNTTDEALEMYLPQTDITSESMRYSVFAGGKRVRPVITLAFCDLFGGNAEKALPLASALEMIHTYSLIFDDLPCMDNDVLRRGKPTNHVVYGESTACLASLGLYARAFGVVAECNLSDKQKVNAVDLLVKASGTDGIVSGQILDLQNRKGLTESEVRNIHALKTGAMLRASALLGCVAANSGGENEKIAVKYADCIGLAFQIRDDILDVVSSAEELGKSVGKDKNSGKTTFVDIMGLENAQKTAETLTEEAKSAVSSINGSEFLISLADYLCDRKN